MSSVKIYTAVSEDLSPLIQGEGFCVDMVRHSDYATLEARCAALAAENAALKDYLAPIGLKVEGTPSTDAFLAEVRAQGVEMFAKEMHADISEADALEFAAQLRQETAQ